MDLCLIIDSSGSIRRSQPLDSSHDNWQLQLQFVADLMDYLTIGQNVDRVGAVVFSEQVKLEFPLNRYNDKDSLKQALLSIRYLGLNTNTPAALTIARLVCFSPTSGDRPDVRNVALIVTDGMPYPSMRKSVAISEAKKLIAIGVNMIAVGITNLVDKEMLRNLSSPPQVENQNFFTTPDFTALTDILYPVATRVCDPTPGIPCKFLLSKGFFIYQNMKTSFGGKVVKGTSTCKKCITKINEKIILFFTVAYQNHISVM